MIPSTSDPGGHAGFRLFHSGTPVVYYQMLFKVPTSIPNLIRSIGFRRVNDEGYSSPPVYPSFTVDIEIWMGHSPRTPASFNHDLPDNRSADFQRAFRGKVTFPQTQHRPDNRYPFAYRFRLDTPFSFRPGDVGLLELRLLSSTLTFQDRSVSGVVFDAFGDDRWSRLERIGVPCSSQFGPWGGNVLGASPMSVGNPGIAIIVPPPAWYSNDVRFFGGLRNDHWAGLTLPYHLDKLGARGCWIYCSFDWEWPQFWKPAGGMAVAFARLDLPNDPSVAGVSVFVQGVRLGTRTNALGMETTQAWKIEVMPHKDPSLSMLKAPEGPLNLDGGQRHLALGPVFELASR